MTALLSETRRPRVSVLLMLAVLFAFFVALTAPRVFTAPLWGDELRTWRDGIEKPLIDVLTWHHNADHAPLGHLLARGGAALFGVDHAWALRLGAWICALACVPAIWRLGRILDSDAAGLVMAALLVVDPNIVFQSTQARMYPPLLLASIVALTAAARLFSLPPPGPGEKSRINAPIVLCVALAVGLWSHSQIYAVLVAVLLTAIFYIARGDRRGLFALIAIVIAMAIGAPGILKLFAKRNADPIDEEQAGRPFAQLEDATRALTGANWLTGVLVACAIAGFVVIARRRGRAVAWMLGGVIVTSVVDLLIAAKYRPVNFSRYLTVLQPSLWAGVAAFAIELSRFLRLSLSRAAGRASIVGTGVALLALCTFSFMRTLELLPAHPISAPFRDAVAAAKKSGARVVILPRSPYAVFARYYGVVSDETAFDVYAIRVPRERYRRGPPTMEEVAAVTDAEPITIVGVVPARGPKQKSAEDPIAFARAIASARGIEMPDIPTPDGTLRVITIRFDGHGVKIEDPLTASPRH